MQKEEFEEVLEIVKKAGEILKGYFKKENLKKKLKRGIEIVTEADIASQNFIVSELKKKFPDYGFLSEEGITETNFEKIFVIDPLDGTDNFASGNPYFSISIALTDKNFNPEIGIVYAPILNQLFYSSGESKSWLNGKKICVKDKKIEDSILAAYIPKTRELRLEILGLLNKLMDRNTKRIRIFGSAALDICYVASGIFDGFFHLGLRPWDFCAARLILEKAGGKFLFKEREEKQKYLVVCGNNQMFNLLKETLNSLEKTI